MHLTTKNILRIFLFTLVLHGAASRDEARAAGFSLFVHAIMDSIHGPSVSVTTSLPHSNLVFLKQGDAFLAEYRLYIRILDAKKKRIVESTVLTENVEATDYQDTRSHKSASNVSHRLKLPPGDYIVECAVEVENTHLVYKKEAEVNVPNFLESGIGLGQPRIYSARLDTMPRAIVFRPVRGISEFRAVPLERTSFTELNRRPAFSFDVYLDESVEDSVPCTVVYQVTDSDRSQLLYGRKRVKLAGLGDQFVVFCSIDDWEPGKYTFAAKAFLGDPPRAGASSLDFSLEFSPTVLTRRFDETLEILALIASPDEMKAFRDASERERSRVWSEFWKRRDPTPETDKNEALEEHLRRVRFVSANFSTAEDGWRSDRGKVYIKHGEPDETETRADPYFQGDYLIWRYYKRDLTFVFYDRFGLGEYRLSDASAF